jgi:signal recognition particle receptor subunit beta
MTVDPLVRKSSSSSMHADLKTRTVTVGEYIGLRILELNVAHVFGVPGTVHARRGRQV